MTLKFADNGSKDWEFLGRPLPTFLMGIRIDERKFIMRYTYVFDEDKETFEHKIEGHKEDNWNVDSLLAPLILHLLKEVKEQKLGTPIVSQEDVPEELRFDRDPNQWTEVEYECNEKQWAWIINEMIYAFDMITNDNYSYDDYDVYRNESDRVDNGTILFGKYFQNLWT